MSDSLLSKRVTIERPPEAPGIEALSVPTQPKGFGFQLSYWAANLAIGLCNITLYTILLPARIAQIAPTSQTTTFNLLALCGALASIFTNPLVGALSDRTTSPLGRRLPWLMGSMVALLLAMLALFWAPSIFVLLIGVVGLQIAINGVLATLSAVIPDQVPLSQRAMISALSGMAPLVGGLFGQILVGLVIKDIFASILILAQISIILLLLFSLVLREQPLPKGVVAPFRLLDVPKSLWLNPKKHPEFALTWGARCLVFLASTTVINYMYYFLQDAVHYPSATGQPVAQGVQQFFLVFVISLLVASLICGRLSDKLQLRKPFVIGSSVLMAVGMLVLAFFPVWSMVLVGTVILGAGFGGYVSSDLALASQLLPEARDRGKDFGLMNAAIFLPMVVAPLLAAFTLGLFHSYTLLFAIIAVGAVIAALLIRPIRSVR